MKPKNERTLVVYRVSKKSSTTENQKYGLDDYITSLPYLPSVIDITATNWRKPIPEMEQLLVSIRSGVYDEVVFWTVDRTGRRHEWDVNFWSLCRKHGVLLRFIADGLRSDRADDDLEFHDRSIRAERERRQMRKRVCLSHDRKKSIWIQRYQPKYHRCWYLASKLEGEQGEQRRTKLWRWLVRRASAKGLQFINPVGGGKNKGNIQGKTMRLTPAILKLHEAKMSKRAIAKTLAIAYHTVAKVIEREGSKP